MVHISNAVKIHQNPRQIVKSRLINIVRLPSENLKSMSQRWESIVDVAHVPMKPFALLMNRNITVELGQHLVFHLVVISSDLRGIQISAFGHLVNREGSCLASIKIAHSYRRYARGTSIWTIVEALTRVVDHDYGLCSLQFRKGRPGSLSSSQAFATNAHAAQDMLKGSALVVVRKPIVPSET